MKYLWIEFVNSDWHDHLGLAPDVDRLDDPHWLREFLRDNGLPAIDPAGPPERLELKNLRKLLQEIAVGGLARRPLTDAQLAALNRYLANPGVRPVLSRAKPAYRLDWTATRRDQAALQFEIAASFANFLVNGDIRRLKICENPNCRWLFYDSTRSRTRRWCASNCGSLIKVRRFRRKQKRSRPSASRRRNGTRRKTKELDK